MKKSKFFMLIASIYATNAFSGFEVIDDMSMNDLTKNAQINHVSEQDKSTKKEELKVVEENKDAIKTEYKSDTAKTVHSTAKTNPVKAVESVAKKEPVKTADSIVKTESANSAKLEKNQQVTEKVDPSMKSAENTLNNTDNQIKKKQVQKPVNMAKSIPPAKDPVRVVFVDKAVVSGLTQEGMKPSEIANAKGFGKDVALSDVFDQIVPTEFGIVNKNNVSLNAVVNWASNGDISWVDALDSVFRQAGVMAVLNWDAKTITIGKSINAEKDIAATMPKWDLRTEDKSLRKSLIRWSKEAGYNLDWDVAIDFPIAIEATFKGDFESAITQVMDSLSGTSYPLQACSYENKTIRVVRAGETSRCVGK